MHRILLVALLTGCVATPIATIPTSNPEMHVDLLFEHDGCAVYRFWDVGNHYYVKCNGAGPTATMVDSKCGKRACGDVPTL